MQCTMFSLSINVNTQYQLFDLLITFVSNVLVFEFESFQEAGEYINEWIRVKKNNPTDFAGDFPSLIEKGIDYRE